MDNKELSKEELEKVSGGTEAPNPVCSGALIKDADTVNEPKNEGNQKAIWIGG